MFGGIELFEDNFPNKKLIQLIKEFKLLNTDEVYNNLISEMENSIFLMPLLSTNNNISGFALIEYNNKKYACMFSNMDEFSKWYKDYELNFMFYSIKEISKIILSKENDIIDGFIIDPYGINMIFDRELIEKRNI